MKLVLCITAKATANQSVNALTAKATAKYCSAQYNCWKAWQK